jgi:hypothetical protein
LTASGTRSILGSGAGIDATSDRQHREALMRTVATSWILRAGCVACGLALPAPALAQTDFARPIFETGGTATAFAYGDLNADGRSDAAVVHASTDKLGIVLAKPGGAFQPPTVLTVGDEPRAAAIADVDLDGRPDVVTFNSTAGTLSLVLLKVTGTVISTFPAGGNGDVLAVGDLDHDGDPDVVTGNSTQKTLSVLNGLGPAGLGPPVTYAVGSSPRQIELADFDGDGSLDVATQNSSPHTVMLWRGNGSGGLLAPTTLASTASAFLGLVSADVDDDLDLDLATGGFTDLILLRNGPGGFAAPELIPVGQLVHPVAAADFDQDGLVDVLVNTEAAGADSTLASMRGTGGGAFAAPVDLLPVSPFQIVVDDADADLRPDVIGLLGGLCVFRSDGEGLLVLDQPVALAEEAALYALGDLDGDGLEDLVSAASGQGFPFSAAGPVSVQLGAGAGVWGAPQLQPVEAVDFIELADVTGDGELDLITTHGFSAHALVVAAGDGAGGFAAPTDISLPSQEASGLASADLDLDGDIDLAVLSIAGGFMGTQLRYLLGFRNDGGGQWTTFSEFYGSAGQFAAEDRLVLGECDGDGLPDAVILDRAGNTLRFCAGGGGQFGSPVSVGTAGATNGEHPFALADLDDDGALDIVVASSSVQVRYGNGDGSFSSAQTLGTGPGDDVRFVDLDGDGSKDLVMDGSTSIPAYTVMVWHADGLGGYTRHRYFTDNTSRSFVTDADQDGRLDLLALPAWDGFLDPVPRDGHVLDNHVLSAAWTDFGHGLAGSFGIPALIGQGTLATGSPGSVVLTGANPNKLAVLFISPTANPAPFKGGQLVPIPPVLVLALATSPTGAITLGWSSWPLLPPGDDWFFQYGVVDVAGPAGASLSNAVRALQP